MIKSGNRVTVHTFGWAGREGTVVSIIPAVRNHFGSSVAMATVKMDGRMTWRGREAPSYASVTLDCVRPI